MVNLSFISFYYPTPAHHKNVLNHVNPDKTNLSNTKVKTENLPGDADCLFLNQIA